MPKFTLDFWQRPDTIIFFQTSQVNKKTTFGHKLFRQCALILSILGSGAIRKNTSLFKFRS